MGGTGVYMREEANSRVTAADRPYGEFYDFYSVSLENFGSTHVYTVYAQLVCKICTHKYLHNVFVFLIREFVPY